MTYTFEYLKNDGVHPHYFVVKLGGRVLLTSGGYDKRSSRNRAAVGMSLAFRDPVKIIDSDPPPATELLRQRQRKGFGLAMRGNLAVRE